MKRTLRFKYARCLMGLALVLLGTMDAAVVEDSLTAAAEREKRVSEAMITEVLKERTDALMSLRGVVGVGQGLCDGQPCVKVYVARKTPEVEQEIWRILEPYPFGIQESGRFRSR